MKKTVLASILIAASSFAPALASPAQDLFDQATFYIGFYYSGPGSVPNFRELRKQYQPELDKRCGTDKACGYDKGLEVINAIIASLNDPFTEVINDDFSRLGGGLGPNNPRLGLITRTYANALLVVQALEGEAGWEAGIERGDLIKTVNGKPATLEALVSAEAENKPITLGLERKGQPLNLPAIKPGLADEGQKPTNLKNTPKNAMVIRISDFYWDGEVAKKVHALVRKASVDGTKNIVLDLRDSDTGFDSEAIWTARAFTDKISLKYKSRFKDDMRSFNVEGSRIVGKREGVQGSATVSELATKPQLFTGNVAVLVNKFTKHTGEIVAFMLQKNIKAKVIGEPTSGQLGVSGGLPSLDIPINNTELINGQYINLSNDRILDGDGNPYPMQVTPDIAVPEDLAALAAGRDPALEKAYELLGVN
jgi:carboxyl-terminal processing protease